MGLLSFLKDLVSGTKEASPPGPRRRVSMRIERGLLDELLAASRSQHPNEFSAVLSAEGDLLTGYALVPGGFGGDRHAILPLFNLPIDRSYAGTVHSHPGSVPYPSDADKQLFRHFGFLHVIIAEPYGKDHWRAFDGDGREIRLDVVDG